MLYELLSPLLNAPTPDLVWNTTYNQRSQTYISTLGGKKLTQNQSSQLQKEAEFISKTELFSVMCETLKVDAHRRMFETSQNLEDIFAGKMLLYALDIIEKVIHTAAHPFIDKPIINSNIKRT